MAPVPLGLLGGGGGKAPPGAAPLGCGGGTETLDRSSGAPGWRGPGDGTSATGGGGSVAAVLVPSGRGAPGAAGLIAGLNASPRPPRPGGGGGGSDSTGAGGGAAAMTGAGAAGGGENCPLGRGGDCGCGDAGGRAPVWLASCSAR